MSTFVGIDVSKEHLDWAVHGEASAGARLAHDEKRAFGALVDQLRELSPTLVVLEATGGLEMPVLAVLSVAGRARGGGQPAQIRNFARATGRQAKTDRLDAKCIAHFAAAVQPPLTPMPEATTLELELLLARRRQLITMLVAEKNRLSGLVGPRRVARVVSSIIRIIETLEKELETARRRAQGQDRTEPALARQGRAAALGPRRRARHLAHAAVRPARAGHAQPQADRGARGRGAVQPRQRQEQGAPSELGWTRASGALDALHGQRRPVRLATPSSPRLHDSADEPPASPTRSPYGLPCKLPHPQRHSGRTGLAGAPLTKNTAAAVHSPGFQAGRCSRADHASAPIPHPPRRLSSSPASTPVPTMP